MTFGRLDGESQWRTDQVPTRGTCRVTIDKIAIDWSARPVAAAVQGEWFDALQPPTLSLKTEQHHKLVAVAGHTEATLIDAVGEAVPGATCWVDVDGQRVEGRTDDDGVFVARHPRAAVTCDVSFPEYDGSICVGVSPQPG